MTCYGVLTRTGVQGFNIDFSYTHIGAIKGTAFQAYPIKCAGHGH